ncbi:hypothetical protein M9H77_20529 [Catharanthus roseus]|uniref:Uncharacterized protein n=1 Tax=Catharanthus roseus TaxID=4058 RepID=A0ACC0AKT4_CATRO|nr:hypothetical protein M9H77_20529 [Catharanthus roseus]
MVSEVAASPQLLSFFSQPQLFHRSDRSINLNLRMPVLRFHSSRRLSDFPKEADNLVGDPLNWNRRRRRNLNGGYIVGNDEEDEDNDEEEEEEDRSLDLLIRFVQNVFKKISRKARKAVRSVLPINISSQLVRFSVDGIIILTFMWVLKAFLEVICTLGSMVFASILLIRGIWAGISYLQENRSHRTDELDEPHTWTGAQTAT